MKRTLCLILLVQISTVAVEARGQTLADAARRERERQRATPSRTYTNDDISSSAIVNAQAPSAVGVNAPEQPAVAGKPTGPVDKQGRDENYWRGAFDSARTDLKRAEDRVLVLETQRNELNLQMLRQSNLYNRENVLRTQLNVLETDLATMRIAAETARQKISGLEEELRRSGGHPGWAR